MDTSPSQKQIVKALFVAGSLLFITGVLFIASLDPTATTSNTYVYLFIAIIPFLLAFMYALRRGSFGSLEFSTSFLMYGAAGVVVLGFMMYIYNNLITDREMYVINIGIMCFVLLLSLFLLATLFNIFSNHLLRIGGVPGLLVRFLFFIPCLLRDGVEMFLKDYATTNNVTIALFAIDLALILGYLAIKMTVKYIPQVLYSGTMLQKDPIFLDLGRTPIASQQQLGNNLSSNYSLAMWVIMNTQDFSQTDATIFCYGDTTNCKPKLTFGKDQTSQQYVYKLYPSTASNPYLFRLPYQRWNHFVFTYNNNKLDLFLNGQLHKSFELIQLPTYSFADTFTIGSEMKLQGSVANVIYYSTPLTHGAIANLYNMRSGMIDTMTSPLVS